MEEEGRKTVELHREREKAVSPGVEEREEDISRMRKWENKRSGCFCPIRSADFEVAYLHDVSNAQSNNAFWGADRPPPISL